MYSRNFSASIIALTLYNAKRRSKPFSSIHINSYTIPIVLIAIGALQEILLQSHDPAAVVIFALP
jgi:hypothetical protein